MESKKINQLATELTPALSDLTIIGDPTTGISKKITLSQMASLFTGTVEEYANLASFPLVGAADTIYIALDTNVLYRWDTGLTSYVELSPNIINSLVFNDANGFDGTISLVGSVATLTITTALTTGSVGFIGASGALLQDNANFFWDDSNNRLGIGTNAPTTALDVFGSGIIGRVNGTSTNNAFLGFASAGTNKWSIGNVQSDHRFRIYSEANTSELVSVLQTGEFGIGIANPTTKLHIDGGANALIANLDANVSVAKSISFRSDNSNRFNIEVSGTESGSNVGADLFIRRYSDAGALIDTPFNITRSTGLITILNAYATKINFEKTYNYITSGGTSNLDLIVSGDDNIQFKTANATITNAVFKDGGDAYFNYNLGIGVTTPSTTLHVSSTTTQLTLQNVNGGTNAERIGMFMTSGDTFKILSLNDNNTTRVDNILVANVLNGNIGIGISTPSVSLDVNGAIRLADGYELQFGGTTATIYGSSSSNQLRMYTNNTERLRVLSNGNVLINATSDPSVKLQVVQTTSGEWTGDFKNYTSNAYGLRVDLSGSSGTNSAFQVYTATGQGLRLVNNGNLLIGTATDPNSGVIVGSQSANNWTIYSRSTASSGSTFGFLCEFTGQAPNNTTSYFYYGGDTSTARFNVRGNGGIYNFSANNVNLSDISTKKDIIPCESYWDKFKGIEIVKFKYIDQSHNDYNIGVIAQQVEQVAPEFIDEDNWAMPNQEDKIMKAVYTEDLHHATIKVLQEAMAKIEALEAKLNSK